MKVNRHRPSWPGGVAAPSRRRRVATLAAQTEWWFKFLVHHPVRSIRGSFAVFFLMSRPPLLARRGDGVLLLAVGCIATTLLVTAQNPPPVPPAPPATLGLEQGVLEFDTPDFKLK